MTAEVIISIIISLLGDGFLTSLYYRKQTKLVKDSEALKSLFDSEMVFIQNMKETIDIYRQSNDDWRLRFEELEKLYGGKFDLLQNQITIYKEESDNNRKKIRTLTSKVTQLEKQRVEDSAFLCFSTECQLRKSQPQKAQK